MRNTIYTTILLSSVLGACHPVPESGQWSYDLTADDESKWTANITGTVSNPQAFAQEVVNAAAKARQQQSLDWFGKAAPELPHRITIQVQVVGPNDPGALGSGVTSYIAGEVQNPRPPSQFQMEVAGSTDIILKDVIPHEVMHTIYASQFQHPMPRWSDEGAASAVESKEGGQDRLNKFLRAHFDKKFGIEKLFNMTDYPSEPTAVMVMYAQGHSITHFLSGKTTKQNFISFLSKTFQQIRQGVSTRDAYNTAIKSHFGYKDMLDLERDWTEWFLKGANDLTPAQIPSNLKLYIDTQFVLASLPKAEASKIELCTTNKMEAKCVGPLTTMTYLVAKEDRVIFQVPLNTQQSFMVEATDASGKKTRVTAVLP